MNMRKTPDVHDTQTLSRLMDGEWHDLDRSACVAALCEDPALRAAWARWHVARDALRGEPVTPIAPDLAGRISAAIAAEPAYSNVTALPGAPAAGIAAGLPEGAPEGAPDEALDEGAGRVAAPVAAGTGGARVSRLGLTGFALAASAALVTVVGLDVWQGRDGPGVPGAAGSALAVSGAGAGEAPGALATATLPGDGAIARASRPALPAPLPEVDLVANVGGAAGSYWVAGDSGVRRGAAEQRLNAFLSQHIESSPTAAQQGMLPYSRLVGYDAAVVPGGAAGVVGAGADAAAAGAGPER